MQGALRQEKTIFTAKQYIHNDIVPLHIYYHIGSIDNDTQDIVNQQITLLKQTGLYDVADKIYYSIVGQQNIILPDKFECIYRNEDFKIAELPIINHIHTQSYTEEFKCMYFHTKGSACNHLGRSRMIYESWRKYMEYFCIEKWKINYTLLDTFDTVGTSLINANCGWYTNHYAGNFWWANSRYLRELTSVYDIKSNGRYKAEMWLLSNPSVNAFNWHKRDGEQTFGTEYYDQSKYRNI